jgi:hypothetical protein
MYILIERTINTSNIDLDRDYIDIALYRNLTSIINLIIRWELQNQKLNTKIKLLNKIANPHIMPLIRSNDNIAYQTDVFKIRNPDTLKRIKVLFTIIENDMSPTSIKLRSYKIELLNIINSYILPENKVICTENPQIRVYGESRYDSDYNCWRY